MKAVAVLHADLDRSPLGTAARLSKPLLGRPVLQRTLERLASCGRLDRIVVVCPGAQNEAVSRLTADTGAEVRSFDGPPYPTHGLVRTTRKWALDSWRGGMANTCFFDEHTHPAVCLAIARQFSADAVVSVAASACLTDPVLTGAMIEHHFREGRDARLVFAQAPPGLTPAVFGVDLLEELVRSNLSPGWINSYRPDQPQRDMVSLPTCYRPPLQIQTTGGRLTADTRRGFETLEQILCSAGENAPAEIICARLAELHDEHVWPLPAEIHIELTTENPDSTSTLRPRGMLLQRSGRLPLEILRRLAGEIAEYDDSRVLLGGFGEPLCHPEFTEVLDLLSNAPAFGVAVRTSGVPLDSDIATALLNHRIDVLQLNLDAVDAAGYAAEHGHDHWERIMQNLHQLNEQRRARGQADPIIAATMIKTRRTLQWMSEFHDEWLKKAGWAVIEGYSDYAGLLPADDLISSAPLQRRPCRQLSGRCLILSDGRVVGCDQDCQGRYIVGNLRTQSLVECWQGDAMQTLRQAHREGAYDVHPLCLRCAQWHRP